MGLLDSGTSARSIWRGLRMSAHGRSRRALAVGVVAGLVLCAPAAVAAPQAATRPAKAALSPGLFARLSSGVALVRAEGCSGRGREQGSGFLVGARIVMTAYHVVRGSCRVEVLIGGHWISVDHWDYWYGEDPAEGVDVDVATLKLHRRSAGHLFRVRTWSPARGTNVSALGHPLGNNISLNQGHVVDKGKVHGVPLLEIRMLGAEGGSGSPLVDDQGNVVSILQIGLGGKDVFGQRTAGVVVGIDLPSWWGGRTRQSLCKTYRDGGIPGCPGAPKPTPPKPTPPPSPPVNPPVPPSPPDPVETGEQAHPWHLGHPGSDSSWRLQVNRTDFDAWPEIAGDGFSSNTAPPRGSVDVMASLTVTYLGPGSASPVRELDSYLALVGASGVLYRHDRPNCGMLPGLNDIGLPDMQTGDAFTYNQCWQVPRAELPTLLLEHTRWPNGFFALRP
jgi:hypothetical protein